MKPKLLPVVTAILVLVQCLNIPLAFAQASRGKHWVVTWATAELLSRTALPAASAGAAAAQNVGTRGFSNQTVRMIARASIGGSQLRVKLSSAFGSAPVSVGAAHIALRAKDSEIVPGSDRVLAFDGKPDCTLGPGVVLVSDPVDLDVAPLAELAVSLYFPGETGPPTSHGTALHNTYISKESDTTSDASMAGATITQSYYWLSAIDVLAPANAAAIVAFGDSITDGSQSTPETDHSWPALLAARLVKNRRTADIAVANLGIGGNRVLRDVAGVSALGRLDRDVLSQSGIEWVMLLEGINDIGHGAQDPKQAVNAGDIINAYRQLIDAAHTHGIKVIGCTLTPYEGAGYASPEGEAIREAVNSWIRTSREFDAVVDFAAATRDPANPTHIRPEFDPGDHLHPNNAGYEAMAKAVDLSIFTRR